MKYRIRIVLEEAPEAGEPKQLGSEELLVLNNWTEADEYYGELVRLCQESSKWIRKEVAEIKGEIAEVKGEVKIV